MALIDLHHRSFAHPGRAPSQRMAEATTVNRRPLTNSPLLQAEIVTIRNLGPEGIPFVPGPRPLALIPLSGALYLEWDAGAVWMDLNQIIMVPGGVTLEQRRPDVGDVAYMSIRCPPDPPGRFGRCAALPLGADLRREASRLATLVSGSGDPPSAVREDSLRIILDHIAGMDSPGLPATAGGRSLTLVQQVRELVQETSTPRSLEDLAACVGASPVYLTSLFRQIEGMPIYRYQARLRLARSLRCLGNTDDITTVAMDLGFASHSHFSTAFRAAFGLTPSAYRASLNIG